MSPLPGNAPSGKTFFFVSKTVFQSDNDHSRDIWCLTIDCHYRQILQFRPQLCDLRNRQAPCEYHGAPTASILTCAEVSNIFKSPRERVHTGSGAHYSSCHPSSTCSLVASCTWRQKKWGGRGGNIKQESMAQIQID